MGDPSTALTGGWQEVLGSNAFHVAECLWYNMGLLHPETKQGFWTNIRILSSMQLFKGGGSSVACRCERGPNALGHAKSHDLHTDCYGRRERPWIRISYYIIALVLSGKPFTSSTLGPWIRPELILKGGLPPKIVPFQAGLAQHKEARR